MRPFSVLSYNGKGAMTPPEQDIFIISHHLSFSAERRANPYLRAALAMYLFFAPVVRNIAPVVCLQHTRFPRVCFGKARTPKEARRAAPRLGFYRQDNDVHGGVHERAAALHRFLGLSLRSCFAPVVCLQHTRCRVYVSAKRERQRNSGQPVLR